MQIVAGLDSGIQSKMYPSKGLVGVHSRGMSSRERGYVYCDT